MPGRPKSRMRMLLAAERSLCDAIMAFDEAAPAAVRDGNFAKDRLGEPWRDVHRSLRRLVDDLDRLNLRAAEAWRCDDPGCGPDDPTLSLAAVLDGRAERAAAYDAGEAPEESPAVAWLRCLGREDVTAIEPVEANHE
jgi:hypothetical protein